MGFFDKLKMEITREPSPEEKKAPRKEGKEKKQTPRHGASTELSQKSSGQAAKTKIKPAPAALEKEELPKKPEKEKPDFEGELAIDVYETDGDFVIQSTIAGIKAEDLDITIENDIVTIRGSRQKQVSEETKKYYYQECYWGTFSRQVILPEEVDGSKAEASIKEGVLTLRIPKAAKIQKRKVTIKQES